jgi:Xaa-Pro aminopeptidase
MITEAEYKRRRDLFAKKMKKNSLALFFAAELKVRSNDTEYPYRQDSNFYYLSGFKEDKSALIFVKGAKRVKTYLFVYKKEKQDELWNGKRLGVIKAKKRFAVDAVFEYTHLAAQLKEHLQGKHHLYYDFGLDYSKVKLIKSHAKEIAIFRNAAKVVQKMRLIKSDAEIALIKKAVEITKEAHHRAMKNAPLCDYEYRLQAEVEYEFKKEGALSEAYTSIVASGNNANTLHYIKNSAKIQKDALVLIDAGCEYEYYASDITRTIPASGKFTKEQREIYSLVLEVQKKIIAMVAPGVLRSSLQKEAQVLLAQGLKKLGILQGSVKKLIKKGKLQELYPHGIGHWLGIDVHDPAPYKNKKNQEIPLAAGMVLTIEPGLYIDQANKNVPKKYRGIGVRIEDDILVTHNGCENLSFAIVKEIDEIEALASSQKRY